MWNYTYLVNRKNPTSHTAIGHGENINIHDSTGYAKKNKFLDRFKYASSNIYSDRKLRIKPLNFFYRHKIKMLWNLLIIWLLTEIPISLKIILFVNELSIKQREEIMILIVIPGIDTSLGKYKVATLIKFRYKYPFNAGTLVSQDN